MDRMELLDRALEIVQSAYATYEWNQYHRTERTDETLEMMVEVIGPRHYGDK